MVQWGKLTREEKPLTVAALQVTEWPDFLTEHGQEPESEGE